MKNTKQLVIILISVILGLVVLISVISTFNRQVEIKNLFTAKMDERTAFYDEMFKTLNQQTQVAKKNDASFRENINIIMSNRADGDKILMKWVQETNPNANYGESVASLYKQLSRTIEAKRAGFFEQEKQLQDIVREHNNLLDKFPSNIIMAISGAERLKYKPITSTRTDDVMRTGKDDNVDMEL